MRRQEKVNLDLQSVALILRECFEATIVNEIEFEGIDYRTNFSIIVHCQSKFNQIHPRGFDTAFHACICNAHAIRCYGSRQSVIISVLCASAASIRNFSFVRGLMIYSHSLTILQSISMNSKTPDA